MRKRNGLRRYGDPGHDLKKFKEIAQRSPNNFTLPKEYIRSNVNEDKIDESNVEYDMENGIVFKTFFAAPSNNLYTIP